MTSHRGKLMCNSADIIPNMEYIRNAIVKGYVT